MPWHKGRKDEFYPQIKKSIVHLLFVAKFDFCFWFHFSLKGFQFATSGYFYVVGDMLNRIEYGLKNQAAKIRNSNMVGDVGYVKSCCITLSLSLLLSTNFLFMANM